MIVAEWMTKHVATVKPLDSILHAREILEDKRVNQLPVVVGHEVVGIIAAGLESGAHAGRQLQLATIGAQRRAAAQYVNELVLPQMRMTQRRDPARGESRQIDAEVGEPEEVTERALLPAGHPARIGLGIGARPRARRGGTVLCSRAVRAGVWI